MEMSMKLITKAAISAALISYAPAASLAAQPAAPQDDYAYQTPLGLLKFVLHNGSNGIPADSIALNNKTLLDSPPPRNQNTEWMHYMPSSFGVDSYKANSAKPKSQREILRIIVEVGGDGNCIKQFIVLDFTGSKPYVSKPFGYNPDGTACLEFKKVKWGKDVSYVYLEGPMKYAYHTGGAVIGPLE